MLMNVFMWLVVQSADKNEAKFGGACICICMHYMHCYCRIFIHKHFNLESDTVTIRSRLITVAQLGNCTFEKN